jgi:hypothetical protein
MTPSYFWQPFEEVITSYDELAQVINEVFTKWATKNRGNGDALNLLTWHKWL